MERESTGLARTIGPVQLMFYALGSMLGAGIYGLIGKAAGMLGNAIWMSFLVAMVAALLTGLTYASLGARYPRAGGAAFVTQRAFKSSMLSYVVGLAVICSGLTSMATGARVIAENLRSFEFLAPLPVALGAVAVLVLLALIVYRGIVESMWVNMLCTLVEAGGLLLVVAVGARFWGSVDLFETPAGGGEGLAALPLVLILQGAVLTFYSFIGFEDTLNVAEECKTPQVTIPFGLIGAMTLAAGLYMAVAITAVSVVPWRDLAAAPAPLAAVIATAAPWFPTGLFVFITIFAVANTVLINFVTASRLVYGMSTQDLIPAGLSRIHPTRRTPHRAIAVLLVVVTALVLLGDISALASATVLLLLTVFITLNGALIVLKLRPGEPRGAFEIPMAVPAVGGGIALALLVSRVTSQAFEATAIAGGLLLAIAALYLATRSSRPVSAGADTPAG